MKKFLGVAVLLLPAAYGQLFSVGVRGGVPFTGGLSEVTTTGVDLVTKTFSSSNQYVVGPMVEVHLPLGLSVEADGLYRPLSYTTQNQIVPQPTVYQSSMNVASWEFPILGKFRFPFPLVKPYVDAGPSFRTVGSSLNFLSNKGITAGLGVELKISKLRIAPEIRYTHWGSDKTTLANFAGIASNTNQGEFLVGISF